MPKNILRENLSLFFWLFFAQLDILLSGLWKYRQQLPFWLDRQAPKRCRHTDGQLFLGRSPGADLSPQPSAGLGSSLCRKARLGWFFFSPFGVIISKSHSQNVSLSTFEEAAEYPQWKIPTSERSCAWKLARACWPTDQIVRLSFAAKNFPCWTKEMQESVSKQQQAEKKVHGVR